MYLGGKGDVQTIYMYLHYALSLHQYIKHEKYTWERRVFCLMGKVFWCDAQ